MKKVFKLILGIVLSPLPQAHHPLCDPNGLNLRWKIGFLRAAIFYRPLWALKAAIGLGPRVEFGRGISIQGRATLAGNGVIELGDDVILDSHVTLFTHDQAARIRIGKMTYVNGTRFGCAQSITIGSRCLLADARIMDTDFHSLASDRFSRSALIETSPVIVEDNCWIAAGAGLLKGVRIGTGSVVAFQAVVTKDVPPYRIFAGNPARDVGEVPIKTDKI